MQSLLRLRMVVLKKYSRAIDYFLILRLYYAFRENVNHNTYEIMVIPSLYKL